MTEPRDEVKPDAFIGSAGHEAGSEAIGAAATCGLARVEKPRRNPAPGDWTEKADTRRPRATSVARHRERGPFPLSRQEQSDRAPAGAPRPTCPRVTTADGRSPGSRIDALRRLPRPKPSDMVVEDFPLTVAGAAAALSSSLAPHSLLSLAGTVTTKGRWKRHGRSSTLGGDRNTTFVRRPQSL